MFIKYLLFNFKKPIIWILFVSVAINILFIINSFYLAFFLNKLFKQEDFLIYISLFGIIFINFSIYGLLTRRTLMIFNFAKLIRTILIKNIQEIITFIAHKKNNFNIYNELSSNIDEIYRFIMINLSVFIDILFALLFLISLIFIHPYLLIIPSLGIILILMFANIFIKNIHDIKKSTSDREINQKKIFFLKILINSSLSFHKNLLNNFFTLEFDANKEDNSIIFILYSNKIKSIRTILQFLNTIFTFMMYYFNYIEPDKIIITYILTSRLLTPFDNIMNFYHYIKAKKAYLFILSNFFYFKKNQKDDLESCHFKNNNIALEIKDIKLQSGQILDYIFYENKTYCIYGKCNSGKSFLFFSINQKYHNNLNYSYLILQHNYFIKEISIIENIVLYNQNFKYNLLLRYLKLLNLDSLDVNKSYSFLSRSEVAKIIIICGLVSNFDCLIFDDLFDYLSEDELLKIIELESKTIIFSSQVNDRLNQKITYINL